MIRVPTILGTSAARLPEKVAVRGGHRTVTFGDILENARRVAAGFVGTGCRRGDRVAVLCTNTVELFELQLACQLAGLILVPLNFRLSSAELCDIAADCTPRLLVFTSDLAEVAADLPVDSKYRIDRDEGAPVSRLDEPYARLLGDRIAPAESKSPAVPASQIATIVYTSGTTGRSKGVAISNAALNSRLLTIDATVAVSEDAVVVQPMPFFHVGAHLAFAFTARGATNVLHASFDPDLMIDDIDRYDVTHAQLVPTMIERFCDRLHERRLTPPASLRHIIYGGAPMARERLSLAVERLGCEFTQMYGMTETGGISALGPADHRSENGQIDRTASAGLPNVYVDVRIEGVDGRPTGVGEIGEVCVRSESNMTGYWNNSSATATAVQDGWVRTGDLAHVDEAGYLYLTGRLFDMIITGGENVYPSEVEQVLVQHSAVNEAIVIGLPDTEYGERVAALVTLGEGELSQDALLAHCRSRLANYKLPRVIGFATELPRNSTGKVVRDRVRALLEAHR